MALPATGSTISINSIQVYYGVASGTTKSMSQLGVNHMGITAGTTINLSATFGGQP
jgi:hypothetical protein